MHAFNSLKPALIADKPAYRKFLSSGSVHDGAGPETAPPSAKAVLRLLSRKRGGQGCEVCHRRTRAGAQAFSDIRSRRDGRV